MMKNSRKNRKENEKFYFFLVENVNRTQPTLLIQIFSFRQIKIN